MNVSRRDVMKAGLAAAGALAMPGVARSAFAGGAEAIRVGVIGAGGRGTGAAINALEADDAARVVALADLFEDRVRSSLGYLSGSEFAARVDAREGDCLWGFDAYRRLLARSDVDLVILATPPHFRPIHLEAAVAAGKHVFMEKPVAVDPAGVRRVIAAGEAAAARNLAIVAGTQRRHEACYLEAMRRLRDGAIGRVVAARCSWNQGGLWVHDRRPTESDMEWQCRNWLYFTWLSGDHIVEQHIHNLDVINWAIGSPPARCVAVGGRQARTDAKYGNVYDHFAVEYEYPEGQLLLSMCRQIDGTPPRVDEVLLGSEGRLLTRPGSAEIAGRSPWRFAGDNPNPYAQEHRALLASIRAGTPLNEARQVAESTLTAIMGRMAAYTGQEVTWDRAMASSLDLSPPSYEFGDLQVAPVATPGRTPLM